LFDQTAFLTGGRKGVGEVWLYLTHEKIIGNSKTSLEKALH
jgi:hypothetical protein